MNEHDDVMCLVRESFSQLRMDTPVESVFARSRVRRRRRLSGLTAATAAAGAAAAVMATLGGPAQVLAGPAQTRSSNPPPSSAPPSSAGPVKLAAFSVTGGPGESTTLIVHKGPQYPRVDPDALRQALALHGIPALVTIGTFCRSVPAGQGSFSQFVHPSTGADGSDEMVINGQAMPSGTRLSIGLFPNYVRMALLEDGAPLSCASTSHQPAVHIIPTATPIR
jgi:hypothetical protein